MNVHQGAAEGKQALDRIRLILDNAGGLVNKDVSRALRKNLDHLENIIAALTATAAEAKSSLPPVLLSKTEQNIVQVIQRADRPLTALEIARRCHSNEKIIRPILCEMCGRRVLKFRADDPRPVYFLSQPTPS